MSLQWKRLSSSANEQKRKPFAVFFVCALSVVVVAASAVMTAFVTLAVMTAIVIFAVMMTVVVTLCVGIELQIPLRERQCRCVCGPGHATVERDACFRKCVARAHADAAADQRVRLRCFQETGERAMSAAVRVHDLFADDFAVRHVIELELLRVAEMLKDLSVFIGDCDSHMIRSFL